MDINNSSKNLPELMLFNPLNQEEQHLLISDEIIFKKAIGFDKFVQFNVSDCPPGEIPASSQEIHHMDDFILNKPDLYWGHFYDKFKHQFKKNNHQNLPLNSELYKIQENYPELANDPLINPQASPTIHKIKESEQTLDLLTELTLDFKVSDNNIPKIQPEILLAINESELPNPDLADQTHQSEINLAPFDSENDSQKASISSENSTEQPATLPLLLEQPSEPLTRLVENYEVLPEESEAGFTSSLLDTESEDILSQTSETQAEIKILPVESTTENVQNLEPAVTQSNPEEILASELAVRQDEVEISSESETNSVSDKLVEVVSSDEIVTVTKTSELLEVESSEKIETILSNSVAILEMNVSQNNVESKNTFSIIQVSKPTVAKIDKNLNFNETENQVSTITEVEFDALQPESNLSQLKDEKSTSVEILESSFSEPIISSPNTQEVTEEISAQKQLIEQTVPQKEEILVQADTAVPEKMTTNEQLVEQILTKVEFNISPEIRNNFRDKNLTNLELELRSFQASLEPLRSGKKIKTFEEIDGLENYQNLDKTRSNSSDLSKIKNKNPEKNSHTLTSKDDWCEIESGNIGVDKPKKNQQKGKSLSPSKSCNRPHDLQFSNQQFYALNDPVYVTGKVSDQQGAGDIAQVEVWLRFENQPPQLVGTVTEFGTDEESATFKLLIDDNLATGDYQLRVIGIDHEGNRSLPVTKEFTILSTSEVSDAVLLGLENATNLDNYSPEELATVTQWVVSVESSISADQVAARVGGENLGPTGLIPNTYIFEFPEGIDPYELAARLETRPAIEFAYPLIWYDLKFYTPPSQQISQNSLWQDQWHLHNTGQTGGTPGADINVLPAWNISIPGNPLEKIAGSDIVLGIVDDGIQATHPDILERYLQELSHNFNTENPNAPAASLNDSWMFWRPRRSDDAGTYVLDDSWMFWRPRRSDDAGTYVLDDSWMFWRPRRSDDSSYSDNSGSNTELENDYDLDKLWVYFRPRGSAESSETEPGTAGVDSYALQRIWMFWRPRRSEDDANSASESDRVATTLSYNGLEELWVLMRPKFSEDSDSTEAGSENEVAVVAAVANRTDLAAAWDVLQPDPNDNSFESNTIESEEQAAEIIDQGLQHLVSFWQPIQNNEGSNPVWQPAVTEASNLSFFEGTDINQIVVDLINNNPQKIWISGKPKDGTSDSLVLIAGENTAAVVNTFLQYDLAEVSMWWEPAANSQPIEDISRIFDGLWTWGNSDGSSARNGEAFTQIASILGREDLDQLYQRWQETAENEEIERIPGAHATAVTGVAGGSNNNVGIVGVANQAGFANIQLLGDYQVTEKQIADSQLWNNQIIDLYNNSWRPSETLIAPPLAIWAQENGVTLGREGLGNIYVYAAGNDGWEGSNVNYNGFANSRHTIAVAAIDHNGEQSWYSETGSSLLISAYSSGDSVGITTTTAGTTEDNWYTDKFGGTSSSAPLISGVIALMLQGNPNLTQRDIQHILIETAEKNDPLDLNWVTNAAGYEVNYKYGFGAIDAEAALKAAISWTPVAPEIAVQSPLQHVGTAIPDNNGAALTSTIQIDENIQVEWAEIWVDLDHSWRGDLEIVLTSPSGTESVLAEPHYDPEDGYQWMFTSNRNWGELSQGDWTLQVRDRVTGETGTLNNWKLNLYGTESVATTLPKEYWINPENGHIYFWSQPGSWTDTQNEAESLGGYLVAVNDAAEQAWLNATFPGGLGFIGLTDSEDYGTTEGNYIWTSGESLTFTNWQPGEPNNWPTTPVGEDVFQTDENGQWNDFSLDLWVQNGWNAQGVIELDLNLTQPLVNVSVNSSQVGENGGTAEFILTRSGNLSEALIVPYAVGGDADILGDYLGLTGTATIPADSASVTIPVTILGDPLDETNETIEIILAANPDVYKVGQNNSAAVTILDDDLPTVTLTSLDTNATEDGNAGQFIVTRGNTENLDQPLTISYTITGTATNGTDYQQLIGTITIEAGMTSATIPIVPFHDYENEENETITLTLNETANYNLGTNNTATVTLENSTKTDWYGPFIYVNPDNGHLYILSQPDTWLGAQEQAKALGGNLVTINNAEEQNWLLNTFGSTQRFAIGLTDSPIYGATEGNFKWLNGEPVTYTNWYPNQPDNFAQVEHYGNMNFDPATYPGQGKWNDFGFLQPITGIIEIDPATLTQPIVNIMVTDAQAGEDGNAGQIVITRVGNLDEALTVNYTVAGTATNGVDYQPLTGTITMPAGTSLVTIPILALGDDLVEDINETIIINLAEGDYQIGTKPVAQINLADEHPIKRFYRQIFGQEINTTSFNQLLERGENGETLSETFLFMVSDESFGVTTAINNIYQDLRERTATEQEVSYWQNRLVTGTSLSQIRQELSVIELIPTTNHVYTHPETGHRYFLTTADTWLGAQEQAKALGGNLVTINDTEENQWLIETFGTIEKWIGLTDSSIYGKTEGDFQWINGEDVTYINWGGAEPNNQTINNREGEDFAYMVTNWNDVPLEGPLMANIRGIVEVAPTVKLDNNLVLDGGFENIDVTPRFRSYPPQPIPEGFEWIVSRPTGTPTFDINNFNWQGVSGTTNPDGFDQSVDIDFDTTLSQSFATIPGQTYQVSLWYARNPGLENPSSTGYIKVIGDTTLVDVTLVHDIPSSLDNMNFLHYAAVFTADSETTTLSIQGDVENWLTGFVIDDVRVTPLSSGN